MTLQGHIIVPTTHTIADVVVKGIEDKMAVRFGGYSRYDGSGGWESDSEIVKEDHVRLVVNNASDMDREQFREFFRIEAEFVKDQLNEDAVLVEIHEPETMLV